MHTLFYIMLLLYTIPGVIAETETNELYSIEADEVIVDDANNVKTYTGNTRIVVSNLIIQADKVAIFTLNGLPSRIEAVGNPISFSEKTPKDNISGTARQVSFDVTELKLSLTEYSIVDPTGNNMKGKTLSIILSP